MTWTPTRVNGWWPQVWADPGGRIFVAYGNADAVLVELRRTAGGGLEAVREVALGAGIRGLAWVRPYWLVGWRERPDLGRDVSERLELDVRSADWSFFVTEPASGLVGGNITAARDGHIVEWLAAPYFRLRIDGKVFTGRTGGAVDTAGGFVCFAETNDNRAICRLDARVGGELKTFPCLAPLHQAICGPDGHVVYGGYGAVVGIDPAGTQQVLTATPWKFEGPVRLWRSQLDGRVWLATTTATEAGDAGVLLRPWGEQACVWLRQPAVAASVAEVDGAWIVACCTDRGALTVDLVGFDTVRQPVTVAPRPPAEAPRVDRPLLFAWYQFGVMRVPAPGNGSIVTDQQADWLPVRAHGEAEPRWRYVSGRPDEGGDGNLDAIAKAIVRAQGAPVAVYVPIRAQAAMPFAGAAQHVIEAYWKITETLAAFEARVIAACRQPGLGSVALAWQVYTSNDTNQKDLEALLPALGRVLAACPHIEAVYPFSAGSGRGTGWEDHPEVHAGYRALVATITGLPARAPVVVAPPEARPPDQPVDPRPPVIEPTVPSAWPGLLPGEQLRRFEMRFSPKGRFRLEMQGDGNLVLTDLAVGEQGQPVWASGTADLDGRVAVLQLDGHLLITDGAGAVVWGSGSHGHSHAVLVLEEDGQVEIVATNGELVWSAPVQAQIFHPSPIPPVVVKPAPKPADRPINGAKIVRDFLRRIFGGRATGPKGPKPAEPAATPEPTPEPAPPADPTPVPPVLEPLRRPTREEVLTYRGHLGEIRDGENRVIWTAGLHGVPAEVRADWLRRYVAGGATHIPIGPVDPGVSYPGLGFPDAPDWNDDAVAIRALLDEIRAVPTVRGHGLIPTIFPDGCGNEDNGRRAPERIERSYPTWAKAIDGIEGDVLMVLPGWEPHDMTPREMYDAARFWLRLMAGRPLPVAAWHGWRERSNGASNDPMNLLNDDPFLADRDPVTGAAYGSGAKFWQLMPCDLLLYQIEPIRTMAEAECGHIGPPGQGSYPVGCWLDNWLHAMCRVGGVGVVDGTGAIQGGPWVHKRVALFETTTYWDVRDQTEPGVTQRVNDRALELARVYGLEGTIGFGTGLPAGLEI